MTEAAYYNALNIFYNGDYFKLKNSLQLHGSWEKVFRSLKKEINIDPDKAWVDLQKETIKLFLISEPEFPELLREIPNPPFGLYIKGELDRDAVCISIVGTRKCTLLGKTTAHRFGATLAESNAAIVSGLAIGIDTAAHQGAVAAGGKTIAVLACGLDYIYPRQNQKLAEEILVSGGAIVSEYAQGRPAYPTRFIERNRIISGLSVGTLIVEAPRQSGSLWTAQFAVDQNRSVFVVPGPVNHPNYAGSHALIRAGATLVTDPKQILDHLNLSPSPADGEPQQKSLALLDEKQKAILSVLGKEGQPTTVDKIRQSIKIEISELNRLLTLLMLHGIVRETGGKYSLS